MNLHPQDPIQPPSEDQDMCLEPGALRDLHGKPSGAPGGRRERSADATGRRHGSGEAGTSENAAGESARPGPPQIHPRVE